MKKSYTPERQKDRQIINSIQKEILKKFPFFTRRALRRLNALGVTNSEILEWRQDGNIFIPACKYSYTEEKSIQCYKISTLNGERGDRIIFLKKENASK